MVFIDRQLLMVYSQKAASWVTVTGSTDPAAMLFVDLTTVRIVTIRYLCRSSRHGARRLVLNLFGSQSHMSQAQAL